MSSNEDHTEVTLNDAVGQLDGTVQSEISLLSGMSTEEVENLGGIPLDSAAKKTYCRCAGVAVQDVQGGCACLSYLFSHKEEIKEAVEDEIADLL